MSWLLCVRNRATANHHSLRVAQPSKKQVVVRSAVPPSSGVSRKLLSPSGIDDLRSEADGPEEDIRQAADSEGAVVAPGSDDSDVRRGGAAGGQQAQPAGQLER